MEEARHEPVHAEAPRMEAQHEERREASPAQVQAVPPAAPPAVHVEFHAVSEHQEQEESAAPHRPQRRRRAAAGASEAAQAPLQLVETQAEVAPPVAEEEELPRRTRPRRRRSVAVENEPLQLVETQPSSTGDNPPAP